MSRAVRRVTPVARPMIYVTTRTSERPSQVAVEIKRSLEYLRDFMARRFIAPAGPPLTTYSDWNGRLVTIEVGFPVAAADAQAPEGRVQIGMTPAARAATAEHRGSLLDLQETYALIRGDLERHGEGIGMLAWEVYGSEPGTVPDDQLVTEVYVEIIADRSAERRGC